MPRSKGLVQLVSAMSAADPVYEGVIYSGNSSTQTISTSFSPDLVIIKRRNDVGSPTWYDSVRGDYLGLASDIATSEAALNTSTAALVTNGFYLGGETLTLNTSGNNYVGWCFKAGGAPVSNTDGNITSSVSANPQAGFSILTYTSTSVLDSVGHGLTRTPEVVIYKRRNANLGWAVRTTVKDGSYDRSFLDSTAAFEDDTFNTPPTDTVIYSETAVSGRPYVSYCFHSVPGVSKIGTYTGNGSTSGPTVTTGFRPSFVMFKADAVGPDWIILDSARDTTNSRSAALWMSLNIAEVDDAAYNVDFNDTGFTIKATSGNINTNGTTYFYMAFA